MKRIEKIFGKFSVLVCGMILGVIIGCQDSRQEMEQESLLQVNDRRITVEAFQALYHRLTADLSDSGMPQADGRREIRRHLLNQLIEKLILLERAEELGLSVTDAELDRAVAVIKNDYPAGTFKTVLLEQAVSYTEWKKELRTRLLMEKVIEQELEPLVNLTQADISAYYEKHFIEEKNEAGEVAPNESLNETLLELARSEKKEKVYQTWIADLQHRYRIDVNPVAWEKMNQAEPSK